MNVSCYAFNRFPKDCALPQSGAWCFFNLVCGTMTIAYKNCDVSGPNSTEPTQKSMREKRFVLMLLFVLEQLANSLGNKCKKLGCM